MKREGARGRRAKIARDERDPDTKDSLQVKWRSCLKRSVLRGPPFLEAGSFEDAISLLAITETPIDGPSMTLANTSHMERPIWWAAAEEEPNWRERRVENDQAKSMERRETSIVMLEVKKEREEDEDLVGLVTLEVLRSRPLFFRERRR